jgi:hypothetical protein
MWYQRGGQGIRVTASDLWAERRSRAAVANAGNPSRAAVRRLMSCRHCTNAAHAHQGYHYQSPNHPCHRAVLRMFWGHLVCAPHTQHSGPSACVAPRKPETLSTKLGHARREGCRRSPCNISQAEDGRVCNQDRIPVSRSLRRATLHLASRCGRQSHSPLARPGRDPGARPSRQSPHLPIADPNRLAPRSAPRSPPAPRPYQSA